MVAVRKVRRDQRERTDGALRRHLEDAVLVGGVGLDAQLLAIAAAPQLLVALAAVLRRSDAATDGRRDVARAAAVRAGLDTVLRGQLRARKANHRGIAA